MFDYKTKRSTRFIYKSVINPVTHTTQYTNEKEYIEVLEVALNGNIENKEELRSLVRTIQPEVVENLEGLDKLGVRITFSNNVVKAIITPDIPQKEFERRFLCSYSANIELPKLFGSKNSGGKGR